MSNLENIRNKKRSKLITEKEIKDKIEEKNDKK